MAYCACTTFADWSLGRVLQALDRSKYADNTIVIFWSDNGYHCGEKNHWEKATLWEQSARCPMFIRTPEMSAAGNNCIRPVSFVDFYPTLIDYCHLTGPKNKLDGQSLRPLIENPTTDWPRSTLTTYGENFVSLRSDRYRHIRYPDQTEELYDHQNDPREYKNLASDPQNKKIKDQFAPFIPQTWEKSLGGKNG